MMTQANGLPVGKLSPTDPNRVLGIEELRAVLGCSSGTIARLIDRGAIKGWRLPNARGKTAELGNGGCQPRRVLLRDLLEFIREHGLPVDMVSGVVPRIVLCGCDPSLVAGLAELCPGTAIDMTHTLLSAGLILGRYGAETLVVGPGVPRSDVLTVPSCLTGVRGCPHLLALLPEDVWDKSPYLEAGYDRALRQPCPPALVQQAIEELTLRHRSSRRLRIEGLRG